MWEGQSWCESARERALQWPGSGRCWVGVGVSPAQRFPPSLLWLPSRICVLDFSSLLPSSQCLGHLLIQLSTCLVPHPSHVWQTPGPEPESFAACAPSCCPVPVPGQLIPTLLSPSREFNFTKCRHGPFIRLVPFAQVKPNVSGWRQTHPFQGWGPAVRSGFRALGREGLVETSSARG